MRIEDLVRVNIRNTAPYSTARDEYQGGEIGTFLDANESPYPNGYNRYPDPHQVELKAKISQIKGIAPKNIFIGNGSDEAIDLLFRIFCSPGSDNALAISPSYGMYRVAADINDIEMREVALREDFSLDTEAIIARCDPHSKLLFLCSPNNPSGNLLEKGAVEYLIENFKGIVVIDEAYIDFANDEGFLAQVTHRENLVVLQTLSKAWGMAGLRLGMAFASEYIIKMMSRVKYPYNINVEAQSIVKQMLTKSISDSVAQIIEQREWVASQLASLPRVKHIYPSDANFLLVEVDNAPQIYSQLIEQGVIVRDRSRIEGCKNCLRITIGTDQECRRLIEIMKQL